MGPALTRPTQVPKVFSLPTVPAMISWKSIFTSAKKCLGRLLQWKHTALFGIVAVIVVPIEQRAGSFGRKPQRMHADHADDVHFAGARHAGCCSSCS